MDADRPVVEGTSSLSGRQVKERLILFDGVCKLCSAWCRFIIRYDRAHRFRLASVQSAEGGRVLERFDMPKRQFDTMVYVEQGIAYVKSEAALRVLCGLGGRWRLLGVLRVCPRGVRDWLYDRIARNRYRLFGRYTHCVLPRADHDERFLSDRHASPWPGDGQDD